LLITSKSNAQWSLTGNAGTNPPTNFLGTTDAKDLVIKTNSTEWIRLLSGSNGLVGFNDSTPSARVHVVEKEGEVLLILQKELANSDYMRWQKTTTIKGVIDSAGHIGIGTSSPSINLDIEDNTSTIGIDINNTAVDGDPRIAFQLNDTTKFSMGVDDGDLDKFKIGTTAIDIKTRLTIDNNGNVGIGTTGPNVPLEISATGPELLRLVTSAITGNPKMAFYQGSATERAFFQYDDTDDSFDINTDSHIDFLPNNTQAVRINSSGKVGIGTTAPSSPLEISSTAANSRSVDGRGYGNLTLKITDSDYSGMFFEGSSGVHAMLRTEGGDGLGFYTFANGINSAQRMVIKEDGKVGIGTASPSSKLEVNGRIEVITVPVQDGNDLNMLWDDPAGGGTGKLTRPSSSIKYKQNVQNLSLHKDSVLKLRPVQFQWKNSTTGKYDVGLIAEEVEQVMPNLVYYINPIDTLGIDSAGNYITQFDTSVKEVEGVYYRKLPVYLLAIVQEQEQRLAQLDSIVSACCLNPQKRKGNTGGNERTNTEYEKKTTGDNNIQGN